MFARNPVQTLGQHAIQGSLRSVLRRLHQVPGEPTERVADKRRAQQRSVAHLARVADTRMTGVDADV